MQPTRRGIAILAAGLAVAALPSLGIRGAWPVVPVLWALGAAFYGADALLLSRRKAVRWTLDVPEALYIGEGHDLEVALSVAARRPVSAELILDASENLEPPAAAPGLAGEQPAAFRFRLTPKRRGTAKLEAVWVRWMSPLGLWSRVLKEPLDRSVPILPNLKLVRSVALRFFADRDFRTGLKIERYRGDGTEFDSLKEHLRGDDTHDIDWKSSARHRKLLSRQFRAERNHQVLLAIDTGHLMSEPLGDIPKLDHALNSALVLAYVCLRSGDRVGLFSFGGRVGPGMEPVSGVSSMKLLVHRTSQIEYSHEETNFTLGLTTLLQRLRRRSLVVVLTDFVDTVTAELMVENLKRLGARHFVLCVSIRDPLLADLESARPSGVQDLYRAVVSHDLLQDREIVHRRLRRMGVHSLDVEPDRIGAELINRYLDIKRRELV